ncbi:MAG: efflux transporter outer membrane subunit [Flavobacteriales bacterium]|nr:efflux transporter outer membrane subunit [Flavobacteriales bacterium]
MTKNNIHIYLVIACMPLIFQACTIPDSTQRKANTVVPESYSGSRDSSNMASIKWKDFFNDPYLAALIDTALNNNQELNIVLQEINIAQNEVRASKGEYLPFVHLGAEAGADKVGSYTRDGAVEHNLEIKPGEEFPEPLTDFLLAARVSWELDIWKKLRNAKKAATFRYLASVEGKNFMVTNLVAEIANSYYELLALDNQLTLVTRNIEIQQNALRIVRLQKDAARVTELAVRKFEAEVLKNQSSRFYIQQQIVETENRINFLVGRLPQPVQRDSQVFDDAIKNPVAPGIPSQLLQKRPDIMQAEMELSAAKLDVKVARARFYPSLDISAGMGYQAFNPAFLITTPESMIYNLAGGLMVPLINRNEIKAAYNSANAKQLQAVHNYERSILNAVVEVTNQLSKIDNLGKSYDLKSKQVQALTQSITISTNLFRSAKADYMEVLMTQRDALEAKMELIETRKDQLNALVNMYQALGGGWN